MIMVFNSIILPISYLFGTDSIAFQAFAPYERSTLTKGYLFPLDKKPTRLSVRYYHSLRSLQYAFVSSLWNLLRADC